MKAKMVKVGDYEVIALMYENGESIFEADFYARKENTPDLIYLQEGTKKSFKNFNEDAAKDLLDMYSNQVDLKTKAIKEFNKTNEKAYLMNGEEIIEDEGEVMY